MANSEVERFMRTIKKVIKTAAVAQLNWKQEMYRFLRNYRATPHCTTGVTPATLLYNRSMNTKLPQVIHPADNKDVENRDSHKKASMKTYADNKTYVKPTALRIGETVLVKVSPSFKKSGAPFEKELYKNVEMKSSLITAENNNGRRITRNSSFFKSYDSNGDTGGGNDSSQSDSLEESRDKYTLNNSILDELEVEESNIPNNIVPEEPVPNDVNMEGVVQPQREKRQTKQPIWMKDYALN